MSERNVMTESLEPGVFRESAFNAPAVEHRATRTVAADTKMKPTDMTIRADASGGTMHVYLLPAAPRPGKRLTVKKIDAGAGKVRLVADGDDLIDGVAQLPLTAQNDAITVEANDVDGWDVVAVVSGSAES